MRRARCAVACGLVLVVLAARSLAETKDAKEEEEDRRQRLTEREDKRRPVQPFQIDVLGHALVLGGEYELELDYLRNFAVGDVNDHHDRLLLTQGIDLEAFYSLGKPLSAFVQIRPSQEQDLLPDSPDDVSDLFVERGEMWLISEDILGSGVSVDVGHLDFEDDRLWWWDDELDGVRVGYEKNDFEVTLALTRELLPDRSDIGYVAPEDEDVVRWIGEASWDWHAGHALQAFVLHQDDHSQSEQVGDVVRTHREDDEDGRLTWLGARAIGISVLPSQAALGYWVDGAWVFGRERRFEFEQISHGRSEVTARRSQSVGGFAVDAGAELVLPYPAEPRLYAGYAYGSGDSSPDSGSDKSFQQTGIQGNESGYGGVERFPYYGVVLGPELSNLSIPTFGVGCSLLRSSSLDLVYHRYRLVKRAESLRNANLDFDLERRSRKLGDEIDLVFAVEEWERLELEFVAAGFRADQAFGSERGTWSWGGFAAVRYAF